MNFLKFVLAIVLVASVVGDEAPTVSVELQAALDGKVAAEKQLEGMKTTVQNLRKEIEILRMDGQEFAERVQLEAIKAGVNDPSASRRAQKVTDDITQQQSAARAEGEQMKLKIKTLEESQRKWVEEKNELLNKNKQLKVEYLSVSDLLQQALERSPVATPSSGDSSLPTGEVSLKQVLSVAGAWSQATALWAGEHVHDVAGKLWARMLLGFKVMYSGTLAHIQPKIDEAYSVALKWYTKHVEPVVIPRLITAREAVLPVLERAQTEATKHMLQLRKKSVDVYEDARTRTIAALMRQGNTATQAETMTDRAGVATATLLAVIMAAPMLRLVKLVLRLTLCLTCWTLGMTLRVLTLGMVSSPCCSRKSEVDNGGCVGGVCSLDGGKAATTATTSKKKKKNNKKKKTTAAAAGVKQLVEEEWDSSSD